MFLAFPQTQAGTLMKRLPFLVEKDLCVVNVILCFAMLVKSSEIIPNATSSKRRLGSARFLIWF
jgi:hypothetical protein